MLDGQGLAVTVSDDTAISAYNKAVAEWLDYKITAMRTLKQAIEIDPDFGLAHQNRGISKAFSGDIDGACSDWNKAVELGVTLPESVASIDCN